MSKTVQLHCPSTRRTVDGFVITPYQANDQIYQAVRLALEIPYAALYTVDAKSLMKLDSIQEDQRILVAVSQEEVMLPDSPPEYEFYDGRESCNIDADQWVFSERNFITSEWEGMTDQERCRHIQTLNKNNPAGRNKLRFTRKWQAIQDDLTSITTGVMASSKELETLIEHRWAMSLDHFLPSLLKPPKLKPSNNEFWDTQAVAGITVLASFTPGQPRIAAEHLEEAVLMRISDGDDTSPVVQLGDVVNAVTIIYERAGVVPAKITKAKSARVRERERKKAVREKRKKGKGVVAE